MAYTIAEDGLGSSAPVVAHADASHPDHVKGADSDLPSPNGVTPDVVERLAASPSPHQSGDGQPTSQLHPLVGHVGQVVGDATVLRNGVEVPLHVGDAIFKGDVIQTGAASAVGISFPDGTALNLVANSQMAINAYSYEANSGANAAHFTLIDGTFGFVAGKVAHDGDMKISTPVATMVVHGGAGWAHELSQSEITAISATLGDVTYSFAVVDDRGVDTHGLYDLLLNGTVVSSIADPHLIWYFDQKGDLISRPLDNADRLFAGDLFHDLDQWLGNVNPQSLSIHGSGSPIDLPTFPELVDLQQDAPSFNLSFTGGTPFGGLPPLTNIPIRPVSNIFIWNGVGNWDLDPSDWNQGFAPTNANDIVTIQSGKASYSNFYAIASLTVDFGAILNIDGGSLTTSAIDNAGLIQLNASGSDPALIINGVIDLVGGGAIHMLGPSFDNFILGVPGSGATLINIDNVIAGSGNIGDGDHNLSFVNEATVDATPILPGDSGLLIIDTGNAVANGGVFEATGGGELLVGDLLVNSGLVQAVGAGSSVVIDNHSAAKGKTLPGNADINTGTVQAIGGGLVEFDQDSFGNEDNGLVVAAGKASEVEFKQSLIVNESQIVAQRRGAIGFGHDRVENDQSAVILAKGRGSEIVFGHSHIDNDGTIEAGRRGLITFDNSDIDNKLHGAIEAKGQGSEISFDRGLIDNSGLIAAATRGEIEIGDSLVDNAKLGTIEALGAGSELSFDFDGVVNRGFIGATWGGFLAFDRSLVDNTHSGEIEAVGRGSEVEFDRDLVKNSGLVGAGWSGTVRFDRSLIWNAWTGVIAAVYGNSEVKFKHDDVDNSGLITAAYGGEVTVDKSHLDNGYSGIIRAEGWSSEVAFDQSHVRNAGLIEAAWGGLVTFEASHIRNGRSGVMTADGRGSEVVFEDSHIRNSGLISAETRGEIEIAYSFVDNAKRGTIEATGRGSEVSFDLDSVDNRGHIGASRGGFLAFDRSLVDNTHSGEIEAVGRGSEVEFDRDLVKNSGLVGAGWSGTVRFDRSLIWNAFTGVIAAGYGNSEVKFKHDDVDNSGLIAAAYGGEVTVDKSHLDNGYSGIIEATGFGSEVEFKHAHVENWGSISATHAGSLLFERSWIGNNRGGTIKANGPDSQISFEADRVHNDGSIQAINRGEVEFDQSRVHNDDNGTIGAKGRGSEVEFDGSQIDNHGLIEAAHHGVIEFEKGYTDNHTQGVIEAKGYGSEIAFDRGSVANDGLIEARHIGEVSFVGTSIHNHGGGTIEALGDGSEVDIAFGDLHNEGLIKAGHGGTVALSDLTVHNKSGVIDATGSGATVQLSDVEIDHGEIKSSNGGLIEVVKNSGDSVLSDVTIASGSDVSVRNGSTLTLQNGTSMFAGTLSIGESGPGTAVVDVEDDSGVTLDDVTVAVFATDDGIDVGLTHQATLILEGGTSITDGTLDLGLAHHIGTVDVEGPTVATLDDVTVTAASIKDSIEVTGRATLLLDGGTTMTNGTLALGGLHSGNFGTVDVESALGATFDGVTVTAVDHHDGIEVGQTSVASLLLDGGTTITGGRLAMGEAGGTGTVDVEGASGATLDGVAITAHGSVDFIDVGQTTTATLTLDGGTAMTGGSLVIGGAGGTGTVDVEGVAGAALHDVMVTGDAIGDNLEVGVTSTSTLTIDSGTTMTGGTLTIGSQGTLQVDPSLAILSGVNLVNHGNIVIDPGMATLTVENDTTITGGNIDVGAQGTLDIEGSTLTHVDISDSGVVDIGNNDTFDPSDVLSFVGHGTLNVEGNSTPDLTLAGLTAGDVIDLKGEVVNSAVWNGSTLFLNGSQVAFTVSGGLPAGDTFAFRSDGHGGTDLKVAPQILSVSGSPASGIENSAIPISFHTKTGGASLTSFVISDIPAGVTLSDGHGHRFTATAQLNSIDVDGWKLKSLTINSTKAGDFTVSALVTVTDSHGYSYSALTTEAVTVKPPPPGPPVFSSASTASVDEGALPNTIVYTAVSADPQNAPITYSLNGTDASHFAIDANSGAVAILATPSFETQSAYHFNVVASEQGFTAQKAVTIDVNDLPPTFNSPTTAAVNEGSPASTVVYTAQAAEPGGGTLTYSLSGQDAAAFNLNANTGALTFKSVPNYDVQHAYDVIIRANETNGGTLSADQNVTITVNPVAATFNSPATAHVNEGVPAGTTVYTAQASEPGGGSLTYSLVGGLGDDAADFSINAQTGAVDIDLVPNSHIQDVYHFTVEATEQSGLSTTEAVTLDINAVPLAVTAGATVHFTGGSAPVVLDSAVTVTDGQSPTAQTSATVSIAAGLAAGDTLAFNAGTNTETFADGATIHGSYNSTTGVLTLNEAAGSAATPSVADFQAALQSVTYSAGLNDPTNGGSDTSRTIDWSFNDGTRSSNTAISTVTTNHVAPTVTVGNNALSNFVNYLQGGSPIILNGGIDVTDNNGVGATLANAQVELLGAQSGDLLSFNNGTDTQTFADGATIQGVYQNGTLTLTEATGSSVTPSVADFQAALRTVAYSSTNGDPSIGGTDKGREIYWVVHDGNSTSGTNLIPANPFDDQPVSNGQPTLGLNQLVVEQGVFPDRGDSTLDSGGIPMAALRTFAGNAAWDGTASAEGQLLPIQQDTILFSLLGVNYGGDGRQIFALPNLGGNVAVGAGANLTLGQYFGSDTIEVHQSNLPIQWGGAGAPLDNSEPSLPVNFLINTGGAAPAAGGTDVAGDVIEFLGNFAPQGYLVAAGQTLSISAYPALYAAIGTTYGGDGVTTFKLPNLVGTTIEGAGTSTHGLGSIALGTVTGSNQIELTPHNLPLPRGSSLPVTNLNPTVALNYIIDLEGIFPSSSGAPSPNEGYLGEIMAYAGTDIPQGWVLAEGQTLPINEYQALFAVLGTTYGGNGTTSFQLPDLVGRAVEGVGQTYSGQTESLGEQSGSNSFMLTSQNLGLPTVDTTTVGILTSAEIDNWTNGTGDGNWSTAGNWSHGAVPGQYPIAVSIGSTDSPTVTGSVHLDNIQLQINGNINIAQGATLAIDNTVTLSEGKGASITFTGASGELQLGTPSSFNATIDGFTGTAADTAHSDAIDLVGLNFASAQFSESYNPATGLLQISDGSTGTSFTFNAFSAALDFASDGHGGTLITAQQANSIAVATGTLVDLTGASNGTVTFAGGTGELKIDNPASFTGHIDGFTGTAPDAAHSDAIDLVGLDYNAAGFHEQYNSNTGVLQVTDGTHTAQFTFDNFGGTLKFASDGHGGTMIFDPPAPTTTAHAVAATTTGGDSFNFSFQPARGAEAPVHFDGSNTAPIESHVLQQLSAWDAQSAGLEPHHQMDLLHQAVALQQLQAHLHSAVILH